KLTRHETRYKSPGVWQPCSVVQISSDNPVVGGYEKNGEAHFVGRALHEGDNIPGKVVPSHGICYVSYYYKEHQHQHYQVLTNPHGANLIWVEASGGQVATGALLGGKQADGEKLYIGRAMHDGCMVVGKINPSHGNY
ncbi:unnamed protein product, partial [Oppiella nova]